MTYQITHASSYILGTRCRIITTNYGTLKHTPNTEVIIAALCKQLHELFPQLGREALTYIRHSSKLTFPDKCFVIWCSDTFKKHTPSWHIRQIQDHFRKHSHKNNTLTLQILPFAKECKRVCTHQMLIPNTSWGSREKCSKLDHSLTQKPTRIRIRKTTAQA